MEVKRYNKVLYHIQNMNICTDGSAFDDFVFCDHYPNDADLRKLLHLEFDGSDALTPEMEQEFLTSSEIYKVYAEEL